MRSHRGAAWGLGVAARQDSGGVGRCWCERRSPPEASSAPAARRFAERTLDEWGQQELLEVTRLLVSELVINAVLHARTETEVVLRTGSGHLRVEVSDRSTEAPRLQAGSPSAPTGRGILIVDRLADDWGVDPDPGGKTVWFELALSPAAPDGG